MLRKRYGINRIKTYYDPNSSDFHTFYDLIEEFENSLSDFEHYSNEVNDDFIKELVASQSRLDFASGTLN